MDWQQILDGILSVAGTALVSIACWALSKGSLWLQSKTKNESLVLFWRRLDDTAERVVKEVYQAYVTPLQAAGQWTPQTAELAKQQALTKLKSYIGLDGLHMLEYVAGMGNGQTIDSFLGTFIESAVHDTKQAVAVASAPLPQAPLPAKSVPLNVPQLPPQPTPSPATPVPPQPVNPS